MKPQAIAKLRRTFIAIAMASFLVVIAFMGTTTAIANYTAIRDQANSTIDAIVDAGGETPEESNYAHGLYHGEASYGLRFFAISFDAQGEVTDVNLTHIALVDAQTALDVSKVAADPATLVPLTQHEDFFFKEVQVGDGSMVVFLDCSVQLENMRQVVGSTMLLSIAAVIITLISVWFFSARAIRGEVERARSQQQFMTNASHELKTPIAVIRANTELTEMLSGETEWTQSTLAQVDRLDGLVRDLMAIVRDEETGAAGEELAQLDASTVVARAVDSFKSVAQQNGLALQSVIDEDVRLRGSEATLEQLTCLLMDNAMKYCDGGGSVKVRLAPARLGKGCALSVANDYAAGADVDYRRFFDRFYRADESHENQQGYGIGLSVAESICKRYHGSIKATWKSGIITFTCILKDA